MINCTAVEAFDILLLDNRNITLTKWTHAPFSSKDAANILARKLQDLFNKAHGDGGYEFIVVPVYVLAACSQNPK